MIEKLLRLSAKQTEVSIMMASTFTWFGPYKLIDVLTDDDQYGPKAFAVLEGTDHNYYVNIDLIAVVRLAKEEITP